jgi:8-oxo-dGTP pyrophosphatase MutT (NUDIX family)
MLLQPTDELAQDARLAVSVILLRESGMGPEVFVQHRVSTMDFAAGMVVFPGGRVDESDSHEQNLSEGILRRNVQAWGRSSIAVDPSSVRRHSARLLAAAVREIAEESGVILDPSTLKPWANWVTPRGLPKRFDTYFFLTHPPAGAEPGNQTTEAWKSEWMRVRDILCAEASGALTLMLPTLTLLDELREFHSVSDALHHQRHIEPVLLEREEAKEIRLLRKLRQNAIGNNCPHNVLPRT